MFIAKFQRANIPNTQKMICQAQIEGIPKSHVRLSFGEPKISFPIIEPGPKAKKIQIPNIKNENIIFNFLLRLNLIKLEFKKLWNCFLWSNSSFFCVNIDIDIDTIILNIIPQNAE